MQPVKCVKLFFRSLKQALYEFSIETQVHGVKYISRRRGSVLERFCWFMLVLLAVASASLMVNTFWDRYISNPTSIVIETNHAPVGQMRFPGVTFCHTNRIHQTYVRSFVKKLTLTEQNVTHEHIENIIMRSGGFLAQDFANETDFELLEEVLRDNRYGPNDVMQGVLQPCRELFFRCRWEGRVMNCRDLFEIGLTTEGYCCTFNGEYRKRKFKPRHTFHYGLQNGLSVIIQPIKETVVTTSTPTDSVKVYIHDSFSMPTEVTIQKLAATGTEVAAEVTGKEIYCTQQVRELAIRDRQCVFKDERPMAQFQRYTVSNCGINCQSRKVLELCGCLPFYYPNTPEQELVCNFTRIDCLTKHIDEFRNMRLAPLPRDEEDEHNSSVCFCPQRCNTVQYEVHTFSSNIVPMECNVDQFYRDLNTNHSVVHVYFRKQTISVYRRDLLLSWIGLVSSLGGVFGLFLGCSFLSGLEILYFLTVRLVITYKKLKKDDSNFEIHKSNKNKKEQKNNIILPQGYRRKGF